MDHIIDKEKIKLSPYLIRKKYFIKKFKIMFGTVNGWLDIVEEMRRQEREKVFLNSKEKLKGKWQEIDEEVWEIDLGDQTTHSENF